MENKTTKQLIDFYYPQLLPLATITLCIYEVASFSFLFFPLLFLIPHVREITRYLSFIRACFT